MDARLKSLVGEIRQYLADARIYLFGSQARGDAGKYSDFDLIIISKKFRKVPFVNRGGTIWRNTETVLPADLLCYTPDEFEKVRQESVIIRDAMKDAVLL